MPMNRPEDRLLATTQTPASPEVEHDIDAELEALASPRGPRERRQAVLAVLMNAMSRIVEGHGHAYYAPDIPFSSEDLAGQ